MPATRTESPLRVRVPARPVVVAPRLQATPEELAVRAQGGSMPAFAELVDRFEARLFNFVLRRVGCAADAEDLTQEAFLRAWQRIQMYKPRWRFSTWLFTIASRLAASRARSRSAMERPVAPREDAVGPSDDLSGRLEHAEARRGIWALVGEVLSPEQQSAVWLRYVEAMAVKDIASVLGRSQVSVRVMLFRARSVLAQRLGEDGRIVNPKSEDRGESC